MAVILVKLKKIVGRSVVRPAGGCVRQIIERVCRGDIGQIIERIDRAGAGPHLAESVGAEQLRLALRHTLRRLAT